jgi:thioredoxin 1
MPFTHSPRAIRGTVARFLLPLALALAAAACREAETAEEPHAPVENLTYVSTNAEFDEAVLKARTPVLVDIYTRWCPPCKKLAPVLNRLAPAYKGKVAFVKVDAEKVPDKARKYRVQVVPTLLIFKNGKETERIQGAPPESRLRKLLDAASK